MTLALFGVAGVAQAAGIPEVRHRVPGGQWEGVAPYVDPWVTDLTVANVVQSSDDDPENRNVGTTWTWTATGLRLVTRYSVYRPDPTTYSTPGKKPVVSVLCSDPAGGVILRGSQAAPMKAADFSGSVTWTADCPVYSGIQFVPHGAQFGVSGTNTRGSDIQRGTGAYGWVPGPHFRSDWVSRVKQCRSSSASSTGISSVAWGSPCGSTQTRPAGVLVEYGPGPSRFFVASERAVSPTPAPSAEWGTYCSLGQCGLELVLDGVPCSADWLPEGLPVPGWWQEHRDKCEDVANFGGDPTGAECRVVTPEWTYLDSVGSGAAALIGCDALPEPSEPDPWDPEPAPDGEDITREELGRRLIRVLREIAEKVDQVGQKVGAAPQPVVNVNVPQPTVNVTVNVSPGPGGGGESGAPAPSVSPGDHGQDDSLPRLKDWQDVGSCWAVSGGGSGPCGWGPSWTFKGVEMRPLGWCGDMSWSSTFKNVVGAVIVVGSALLALRWLIASLGVATPGGD